MLHRYATVVATHAQILVFSNKVPRGAIPYLQRCSTKMCNTLSTKM